MAELLPCPFCGGEARIGVEKYWYPKVSRRAICEKCYSSTGWYDTEEQAINAWNTRTPKERGGEK
jgi:Lar family restriction alleviation protein